MMFRQVFGFAAVCALLVSCGSDGKPQSVSTVTSVLPPTALSTIVPVTTAPATTVLVPVMTSAPAAPSAIAAGALIPEVLCIVDQGLGLLDADVYFAVDNQSDSPVALADPTANVLTGAHSGADGSDNPLVPGVFGLGRTSPAFLAVGIDDTLSWSLVGPDGQTRTATATADSPVCTEKLLTPSIVDEREFSLDFTVTPLSGTEPPTTVTVAAEFTGLAAKSVCGVGLDALPVRTGLFVSGPFQSIDEPITLELTPRTDPAFPKVSATAFAYVEPVVIDTCAYDGQVSRQWPLGAAFAANGVGGLTPGLCVAYDGASVAQSDACLNLGFTGGGRVRGTPPTG